jgi:hypothetical protein
VSLSSIASLSITQNSLFNELASATKSTSSTNNSSTSNSIVPTAGSTAIGVNGAESSNTSSSNPLANDLAALLKSLGSGDVNGAKAALQKVEADLQAQKPSNATASSAASLSSTSSTSNSSSSQSSNPLTNLLNQLSNALNSGDSNTALQDLTNFLLTTGQGTGSGVNVTA